VTSLFTEGAEEIVYGFLFWPEVAEEVARIAREHHALFRDQFLNLGMPLANAFLGN